MKRTFFFLVNAFAVISIGHAQSTSGRDTVEHSSQALIIKVEYYRFGGGLGGKFWLSKYYALGTEFLGRYEKDTHGIYSDIAISVAIERHFHTQANVSPYLGLKLNPRWTLQNFGLHRYTFLKAGIIFGVESWIFENVSVSGEQFLGSEYYLNSTREAFQAESTTLTIAFYF